MKILVVDDCPNDRALLRFDLELHGCQVFEAGNGREGLVVASAEILDLIVTDCLMPVMDGLQLLCELKKRKALGSMPVLFYSAVYTGDEARLAEAFGASGFLEKPKSPEELWVEIGRILTAGEGEKEVLGGAAAELSYALAAAVTLEERVGEQASANEALLKRCAELERRVPELCVQLAGANEELEMFSHSISHDLRAPLRHIDGFSQALLEECQATLNGTGVGYLARIRRSCERMLGMLDAILELSNLSRGEMEWKVVELSSQAEEVAATFSRLEPKRRVEFRITPGMVARGDGRLLRVVLEQLLSNAWKMTAKSSDSLIEFYQTTWEGREAFAVRDNGVGFDMAYAGMLFAPFQMMHSSEDFPGRGVGLAIARRIIGRHGGKIRAQSSPGKGATFTFTL